MHEFTNWAGVQASAELQYDWDDVEGNTRRRLAGLAHEALRLAEMKRRKVRGGWSACSSVCMCMCVWGGGHVHAS